MSKWKLIGLFLTMGMIYPLAFALQVAVDTWFGHGEFAYALLGSGKYVLLKTLLSDALRGTALVALLFAILVPFGWAASRWSGLNWFFRTMFLAMIVACVLSPVVFGVPLMLGAIAAVSGLGVSLWMWRGA